MSGPAETIYMLRRELAAKDAEIERLTGERDRQYEYNVGQIAKQAELEAEIERLREALVRKRNPTPRN